MKIPLVVSNDFVYYIILACSRYLPRYVQVGMYIQIWYVDMALVYVCVHVCYWLLTVQYAAG